MRGLILGCLILGGCGSLRTEDVVLEAVVLGAMAADYATTQAFLECGYSEQGPVVRALYGRHPTSAEMKRYYAMTVTSHILLLYALPEKYRPWLQGFSIVTHGYAAWQNSDLTCRS